MESKLIIPNRNLLKAGTSLRTFPKGKIPTLLDEGEFGMMLDWQLSDTRTGKVIQQWRTQKGDSYVRQFIELLFIAMAYRRTSSGVTLTTFGSFYDYPVRDYAGTSWGVAMSNSHMFANGGTGITYQGIVVGTGSTAPTLTDYKLQTQIAHGTGSGQLQYGGMSFAAPASDSTTSQFTMTRGFANASGGTVTVYEIGLYVSAYTQFGSKYFMTIRDVIGGGITVPNGITLTVNIRPQATV